MIRHVGSKEYLFSTVQQLEAAPSPLA